MGAKDSDLDITIGPLTVGLHPDRDPDAVYLEVSGAKGSMPSAEWLSDVVAVLGSDFDDHAVAAGAVARACKIKLDDDEELEDALTVALQALRREGNDAASIRWHWGELGIDGKAEVSMSVLRAAIRLSPFRCGVKIAALVGAPVQPVKVSRRLGEQVRFIVG